MNVERPTSKCRRLRRLNRSASGSCRPSWLHYATIPAILEASDTENTENLTMATLHVRNIPDGLHERLRDLAERENRSLSAEVVSLLDAAVRQHEARARSGAILRRARRRRIKLPPGSPTAEELIREDRER